MTHHVSVQSRRFHTQRLPHSFRMVKRVSSLVSDAIQCLTLIKHGGDMTTGVDSVLCTLFSTAIHAFTHSRSHARVSAVTVQGSVWAGCSDGSLWIFDASSEALLYR
jgi:hypothetical protein